MPVAGYKRGMIGDLRCKSAAGGRPDVGQTVAGEMQIAQKLPPGVRGRARRLRRLDLVFAQDDMTVLQGEAHVRAAVGAGVADLGFHRGDDRIGPPPPLGVLSQQEP